MNERLPQLRAKSMKLPLRPGVYIMKDKKGVIIYIGKAKALKNRVSTYFGSQNTHTPKVRRMVEKVHDFDYIVTDSEYEALVLECSLIKLHSPHYNILLKDDKGYNYIRISNEDYPRISVVRRMEEDGSEYIGPYTSTSVTNQSVDEVCAVFRLPTCRKKFPQDFGKGRACLNHSIGRCMGVCRGNISPEQYAEAVREAVNLLRGGTQESIERLTRQMNEYAQALEFEKAARARDRITALKKVTERQKVILARVEEQDVFALVRSGEQCCVSVLRFVGGRLVDSEIFVLDDQSESPYIRSQLIRQYYSTRERIPPRITLDGECEDGELLEQWLSELRGKRVSLGIPQRGEQAKLVEMCRGNAAEHLANLRNRHGSVTAALDELARLLGMTAPPERIEAYDISNTAGENNVAGMVVFEEGRPKKSDYRRFKIRTFSGQDDYGSMREVITRRIDEYHKNRDSGEGFGALPDLILLDGGEGHVNAVRPLLEAAKLDIPLFGMVKDSSHRTRAIAAGGREIAINGSRQAFTLVSRIQDEVHRYAITYHRQQRSQTVRGSTLCRIEGIGPAKAKALLAHFGTLAAVKEATVQQLAQVRGISTAVAEAVYGYFHG